MLHLRGKRGLIMGVANERSIAWGIAKAMSDAGAGLAFTYQGDAFGKRLEPLAQSVGSNLMMDVDVTDDASLDKAFQTLAGSWGSLDFVVHAIAYSEKNELTGRFLNTTRENFKNSLDISSYSFIEIAPLDYVIDNSNRKELSSVPISEVDFPKVVYMVVDKKIELEIKLLKDFPEWEFLPHDDLNRKTIEIFFDLNLAKRSCNKEQKVLKVPNTDVFRITAPILLEKGISRIVCAENLIAL